METLSAILKEVRQTLDEINELDFEVLEKIKGVLIKFDEDINSIQQLTKETTVTTRQLQASEVLKEQLNTIKKIFNNLVPNACQR